MNEPPTPASKTGTFPTTSRDPSFIRVSTCKFTLGHTLDLIDQGDLELAPDAQHGQVWKLERKSALVESVLLRIPLPAFYFAEDREGALRVVDGLQRLSILHAFVRGGEHGFRLTGLEYVREHNNNRFADLPAQARRRIRATELVVHIIEQPTPDVVRDIFKRLSSSSR